MSRRRDILLDQVLSNSSSRSVLRARTPMVDGEENGSLDVNFQSIEELLAKKLDLLQLYLELAQQHALIPQNEVLSEGAHEARQAQAIELNKLRIQSHLTTVNEIIGLLQQSRSDVSSQLRELLLAQLYKIIVAKPITIQNEEKPDEYVGEDSVSELIKLLTTGEYRSASEFLLLYRSTIALLASDIEEFGALALPDLLNLFAKFVQEPANSIITNENKSSIITGFSALLMVLHSGSSLYGIDDKINWLMEIAEGYESSLNQLALDLKTGDREYLTFITDENLDLRMVNEAQQNIASESGVAVAALHGAGALLTLLPIGEYRNEFITDITEKLVPILDGDLNIDISKAAARVIAICYELYHYEKPDEGDDQDEDEEYNYNSPYYEQGHLLSILRRISQVTLHKVAKKDKKVTNSIFNDVLNTVENYTDLDKRIEIYKKLPKGLEILSKQMDGTKLKLLRLRVLPINSWYLYIRLVHLKWLFLFGVHSQLIGNEPIREVLKEPHTEFTIKYGEPEDILEASNDAFSVQQHQDDDKSRSKKLKKARANKLIDEVKLLTLDDKDN